MFIFLNNNMPMSPLYTAIDQTHIVPVQYNFFSYNTQQL